MTRQPYLEAVNERVVVFDGAFGTFVQCLSLPADDFGVRDGYRRLQGLPNPPTPREISSIGGVWSPDRTIAAWYLWLVPRCPRPA